MTLYEQYRLTLYLSPPVVRGPTREPNLYGSDDKRKYLPISSRQLPGLDTDTPNAETRLRERQLHYGEHRLLPAKLVLLETCRLELEVPGEGPYY